MLGLLLGTSLIATQATTIELDAESGDAWTFQRTIRGTAPIECAELMLHRIGSRGRASIEAVREGRRFLASVPLQPGGNRVFASCRLRGKEVRSRAISLRVPLEDRPVARIRIVPGDPIVLDAGASTPSEGLGAPIIRTTWSVSRENPEPLHTAEGARFDRPIRSQRISLRVPSRDGEYYVALEVEDEAGAIDRSEAYFVVEEGWPRAVDPIRERPGWVERAVVYGAVPFLFGKRGIADVTARLDDLRELGADTVWLSPILASPDDDYGYAVTDYFRVRESYGSKDDLRELVREAHARGMRVILDFVPNHTSDEHPYFLDAARRGTRSPYYSFYERLPDGTHEHYFGWSNLPNLDYDHSEVKRFITEAFAHWVRELDVDGFRVDAAWGLRKRAPELFSSIAEELLRIKPDLFLLVEASARDRYWAEHGADAAYDWTERAGEWAWKEAFGGDAIDVPALRRALAMPWHGEVLRFLDNNDSGERFATRHGEDAYRVAAAMLFTLPGIPALFTGDEVAAEHDPYQRLEPLSWRGGEDRAVLLKRLIALRKTHPSLAGGEMELLPAQGDLIAYRRGSLLVVLNFGERDATFRLPQDWSNARFDHFRSAAVTMTPVGGGAAIDVAARSALILER